MTWIACRQRRDNAGRQSARDPLLISVDALKDLEDGCMWREACALLYPRWVLNKEDVDKLAEQQWRNVN